MAFGDRMSVEDRALLGQIEAIYEAGLERFVRTAAAITGDREAGRDAVHDAFVSAVRRRSAFRGEAGLEAWLWRIVIHAALRARQRATRAASTHEGAVVDELTPENGALVRAQIALLPERQRLVLFLRYYADLDYQQIADTLGIRRGTVSATLHAAHASIRKAITEVIVNG
jgi:RNA polymerase sigma factor (sigma-70 family)